ncbi:Glutathione S-transferase C-terminal domain-containing protein [Camelus dromedarius]|uniref:Glutathione S-transferase C-terminal domain-containing protein n=1 Tax=Camelus dromedarius TaxID=9838 RepID=A0A5N4EG49_CAMDR|nr:Glutathione S-transferase C-terminal domain-containing protein [Camelus dromedarius]
MTDGSAVSLMRCLLFLSGLVGCEWSAGEDSLKRPRESRLRRGGNALAARVADTFTHPPCLAAPLRPVVERPDNFCRAGLAVVLRHIIQKSYEADPSKKEILELLGFKKTCLKACAEVSQWTRLCELTIPLAVENFLKESSDQPPTIPAEILELERKLSEPVRVHNDDKLRRQKLKQQKAAGVRPSLAKEKAQSKDHRQGSSEEMDSSPESLELKVAFAKLTVHEDPAPANREPSHIRKAKASDLPPLEHVFAEGLYFTLADIVLLPFILGYEAAVSVQMVAVMLSL